eukprot:2125791-Alexandrium_andersonii.AAC.1
MGFHHRQALLRRLKAGTHLGSFQALGPLLHHLAPDTIRHLAAAVEHEAQQDQDRFTHSRTQSWKRWACEAVAGGGKRAHAWIKGPQGWQSSIWHQGMPAGVQAR